MYLDDSVNISILEKPSNEFYETDMKHTVKYLRLFLRLLGVWPLISKDSSIKQKCFSAFLIVICMMAILFITIPPSLDLILRKEDSASWMRIFTAIIYHGTNGLKYVSFVLRYKSIRHCVEHVKIDWMRIESEHHRVIMLQSVKFGHSLTVICCLFTWAGVLSYMVITPLMLGKTITEYNTTVRSLPFSGYDIIFDSRSSVTYEFIFWIICFSGFVSANALTASCSFTAGFVCHACGQMQVIVSQLETLVDGAEDSQNCDKIQKRLSLIIQDHIRVLSLSSRIENAVKELCFVEVVSSTMMICLVEYYLFTEWGNSNTTGIITYFINFVACSLNILLFCYIGELLKEQGYQFGKAAYMIEWYRLSNAVIHDLMMIIIMDNNPPKITAGHIFELSIASFGAIMRMSMTYCNMLRTITTRGS